MGFGLGPDCGCCFSCTLAFQTPQGFYKSTDTLITYFWLNLVFTRESGAFPPFTEPSTGTHSSTGYMLQCTGSDASYYYFQRPTSLGYPYMTAKADLTTTISTNATCPTRTAGYRITEVVVDDGANGTTTYTWNGSSYSVTSSQACARFVATTYLVPCALRSIPATVDITAPAGTNGACGAGCCCSLLSGTYTLTLASSGSTRDGYYFSASWQLLTTKPSCIVGDPIPNRSFEAYFNFTFRQCTSGDDCDQYAYTGSSDIYWANIQTSYNSASMGVERSIFVPSSGDSIAYPFTSGNWITNPRTTAGSLCAFDGTDWTATL